MKQNKFFSSIRKDPKKLAALSIAALAFIACLWELIDGYYFIKGLKNGAKVPVAINQLKTSNSTLPVTTVLFGDYVPNNLSDMTIKQSVLDVQIVGILFSAKKNDSHVIMRAGGGEEKDYFVGDTLPGDAVIKRISENDVVVLHNGSLESLSLSRDELIFDAPAKPLIEE